METEEMKKMIIDAPGKLLQELQDKARADRMVRQLWEIAASSGESREIKKAAKKALYTLRSRGIDVDTQKPHKQTQKKRSDPDEIDQAMLSLSDSKDNYMLIISTSNRRTLALDVHQLLLDNRKGILDYRVEGMSKRSFERFMTESEDFFPVPAPYALSRLHRAVRISPEQKLKRVPKLLTGKKEEVEHPILSFVGTNISRIQSPSDEKKIFTEREIGRISLPTDEVNPFIEEIREAGASRLILDNMSPEQRVEGIVDRFCRAYFTEERRKLYREQLFDIALYYHHKEKEYYTRILVEFGKQLMNMSADIKAHPFVQFLIHKDILQRV
jgi:hypothetical protein